MLGKKSERVGVGNLMRIWGLKRLSTGLEFTTLLSETNEGSTILKYSFNSWLSHRVQQ